MVLMTGNERIADNKKPRQLSPRQLENVGLAGLAMAELLTRSAKYSGPCEVCRSTRFNPTPDKKRKCKNCGHVQD